MPDYSEATSGQGTGAVGDGGTATTEAFKSAASLAVVQVMRTRNFNVMEVAKFGVYDAIWSKYLEGDNKKLFGIELPKLKTMVTATDANVAEAEDVITKWAYVVAISFILSKTGFVGGFSRKQCYDFALAYAVRHAAGVYSDTA